ncbi:RNB domain-containing ribonuclease [Gordonia pseudamarae]|uniref:RNB domain-containing ribonuclease n=1 Tax=Gordonia pseudamarae TaxID=2831662 RepID=A0ABX6IIR9_9ACTN|nr:MULTISPECIES: RNB domain-containing ribonuclease [Gordonia]MBD0022570.1 RNB domain-containing ribonuclease [Gordonia sp. (in: high G+C Gram-positive bacteria)]QHN26863.1 RNB domain-containing ribonuclease [Gordonia pseudamarae]QHN35754.1 RNB domain-containing ribonuclease [Gordonia pseudamarae]
MHRRFWAPDIDFDAIRTELGVVEDYGDDALAEARGAVDRHAGEREDRTDLPVVTIDPPTSMDLDQAVHIARDGDDFVIDYAIADVAALIEPEGALDAESRRRGTTVYFPDGSVPLHPRDLSEGAGSLLPEQIRPCVLWTIRVSAAGEPVQVRVRRATVRSVAKLTYAGVYADACAGRLHPSIAALPDFGELRARVALDRGAVDLNLPDQEVVRGDGGWSVQLAPRTPADGWNSQLSLLTGMCAGRIMADAGAGLLRTLPPGTPEAVGTLRATAAALGVPWPDGHSPGRFLAGLAADEPSTPALMNAATSLMRGADYLVLGRSADGVLIDAIRDEPVTDEDTRHAAIAGQYAHVTAPLRRLGDRFATEVCLSVTAGKPVPDWVDRALPSLPKALRSADSLNSAADRASVDLAESIVLEGLIGQRFSAVTIRAANGKRPAEVYIDTPAVIAPCDGEPEPGRRLDVELSAADPVRRQVRLRPVTNP